MCEDKLMFRFWDKTENKFVEGLEYAIDQWGNVAPRLEGGFYADVFFQKYIGVDDKNEVQIFEDDVVSFVVLEVAEKDENSFDSKLSIVKEELLGVVNYKNDFCAYYIGDHAISNLDFENLEVVGNIYENYFFDEQGNLTKS